MLPEKYQRDLEKKMVHYSQMSSLAHDKKHYFVLYDDVKNLVDKDFFDLNQPKKPLYEISSCIYRSYQTKNSIDVISFLSYEMGENKGVGNQFDIKCKMFQEATRELGHFSTGFCLNIYNGYVAFEISQLITGHKTFEKELFYQTNDYEEDFKFIISSISSLASKKGIQHNFCKIKNCVVCKRFLLIDKHDEICSFCLPESYNEDNISKELPAWGYIYFCTDDKYIKIGSSKNFPNSRVYDLSTKYHKKFTLLGFVYTQNFRKKEREIHRHLSEYRVNGEWFDITFSYIQNFLKKIELEINIYSEPL